MIPDHPFAPAHSRESFLETPSGREALDRLDDGLGAREPFLLLTGEPGTGKTVLAHEAVARWGPRVTAAFLALPALAVGELLEESVRRFGAEPSEGASRPALVACLERVLGEIAGRGQVAVIVVDDAHDLSAERLEELRLLANAALQSGHPLEVLLVGLPALEHRLAEPAMAALRQRVSARVRVAPLSEPETRRYLHHRVSGAGGDGPGLFSRRSCRDIATFTNGVPRDINTLATEALRLARAAGQPTVAPEHVQAAATALWGIAPVSAPPAAETVLPAPVPTDPAASAKAVKESSPPAAPAASPATGHAAAHVAAAASERAKPSASAKAPETASPPASAPRAPSPRASSPPASSAPAPRAAPARSSGADAARPLGPASQDPKEWVQRFIGDRGPLQLSSRAFAESNWAPEPPEEVAAGATDAHGAPKGAEPRRRSVALPPLRPSRRRGAGVPLGAALVTIVVIAAVALMIRAGGFARRDAVRAAKESASAGAPQSEPQGALAPGAQGREGPSAAGPRSSNVSRADGTAPPPSSKPATGASRRAGGSDAGAAPVAGQARAHRYTIEVGAEYDLQQALDERDRVQELTGIQSWVVFAEEGTGEPNRIVVGIFRSAERAGSAARALRSTRTLSRAIVVPLPPPSRRQ